MKKLSLYNLNKDISESNDLSMKMKAKTQEILMMLNEWRNRVNVQIYLHILDFNKKMNRLSVIAVMILFTGFMQKQGFAQIVTDLNNHWNKIILEKNFTSESVFYGDFNNDGIIDIVASGRWYEGPDFKNVHDIFSVKSLNPLGYSPTTPPCWVEDFNQDGWDDIFYVIRQPGPKGNYGFNGWENDTCWIGVWFENPGSIFKKWERHIVLTNIANETVVWEDINDDGIKDLVYSSPKNFGYATYSADNVCSEWTFHPISHKIKNPLSHGVGCGDVNGDKLPDILSSNGWWEQPSKDLPDVPWKYHQVKFAKRAVQMYVYDVDGDGLNDIITVWDAHEYGLVWHRQILDAIGQRTWEIKSILPTDTTNCNDCLRISQLHALEMADVNGDGLMDLVAGKRYWAHGPNMDPDADKPAIIYWFELKRNKGNSSFIPHLIDDDSGVGNQVVVVDVNGDGNKDIITSNKKGTSIIFQKGKTTICN